MIMQIDIENIFSINNNQRLSFVADKKKEFIDSLIDYENYKILPTVGLYGKNASGKTNIIKSITHMKNMILNSHQFNPAKPIEVYKPFKFSKESNSPSKFELMFVVNDKRYIYGFSHNSDKIIEEYLYVYISKKATKIFERNNNNYSFGKSYQKMNDIVVRTHQNKLFLSVASQWVTDINIINEIYSYFANDIINYSNEILLSSHGYFYDKTSKLLSEEKEARDFFKIIIKHFDLEMSNIEVEITPVTDEEIGSLPEAIKKIISDSGTNIDEFISSKITSKYKINNEIYELELSEESNGVQKLYELFSILYESFKSKKIVIMDEIEMGLHPILVKELVRLFQNKEINIYGSQLIFTTHDTNILDLELLRRDQLWFTKKDENYATIVYSLADIGGVRVTDNIARAYLLGTYSSIPLIGKWQDDVDE